MFAHSLPINIGQFSYFPNKSLGKGATGQVFQGVKNSTQETVAVKIIRLKDIDTPRKRHLLDCEINGLTNVHHSNVINVYAISQDADHIYIPMQHCPNGTLRNYIKSKRYLPENEAMNFFHKIVEGYCQIVKRGFIHRDLKTENILLRANMDPVIIDFGYCEKSQTQNQKLNYNVGSPAYMSPEAYNDSRYSEKSDIWALGIILHEMVTGTIPKMWTMDVNKYFKELALEKTAVIVPAYQSQFCMKILSTMLTVDFFSRPTASELKNMLCLGNNLQEIRPLKTRTRSVRQLNLQRTNINQGQPMRQKDKAFSRHNSPGNQDLRTRNHSLKSQNFIPYSNVTPMNLGIGASQKDEFSSPTRKNKGFQRLRNQLTGGAKPLQIQTVKSKPSWNEAVMTPMLPKQNKMEVYSPTRTPNSALLHKGNKFQTQHSFDIANFEAESPLRNSLPSKNRNLASNTFTLRRI